MMAQQVMTQTRTKTFLDVPSAARLAGFSIRHFRRIIEEDEIPIMQIGRKFASSAEFVGSPKACAHISN